MASSITQTHNASTTRETPNTPADRAAAFALVAAGIAGGLPVPERTNLYDFGVFNLLFDDADTVAVDRWASWLNLTAPARRTHVHALDTDQPWLTYEATCDHRSFPALPGWQVMVSCTVLATDAEITAARDAAKANV